MNLKLWILFCLCLFTLYFQSLFYPFFWDDFHLIRNFSISEFTASWSGNWDPDKIETPGFRPLTLTFNWARYTLFKNNAVAHRIFLIFLFSVLCLQCYVFAGFFLKSHASRFFAALLLSLYKVNYIHVCWLSDGIHIFQGILCLSAAIYAHQKKYMLFEIYAVLALFCREDSLGFILAIIFLIFTQDFSKRAIIGCTRIIIFAVVFFLFRATFIPAGSVTFYNLFPALHSLILPAGKKWWFVSSALLITTALFWKNHTALKKNLILIICTVIASLHTVVLLRSNVLLLPSVFSSVVFASFLQNARISRIISALLAGICIVCCTRENIMQQKLLKSDSAASVKGISIVYREQCAEKDILSTHQKQYLFTIIQNLRHNKKEPELCSEYDLFSEPPASGMFSLY